MCIRDRSWIDKHIILAKKIIDRERELGMTPIQQGFSGYVPRELKDKYPEAKMRLQPGWGGFKGAGQLDPTDALFAALGRDFLEEEKNLLEDDATSLVTIWGADGDPSIFDYSWREWTGLITITTKIPAAVLILT